VPAPCHVAATSGVGWQRAGSGEPHRGGVARGIEQRVKEAIVRSPDLDDRSVWATADGSVVTLHGSVRTFSQRQTAEHVAKATAGVTKVSNRILVLPARA
jgi:BON domain